MPAGFTPDGLPVGLQLVGHHLQERRLLEIAAALEAAFAGGRPPGGSRSAPAPAWSELEQDPHALLARLREREPVSWLPALDGWLVTRRDIAMQVMRDPERFTVDDPRFSTGQVVGPSMLTLDGEEHRRHREPFAGPFRLAAVRARFAELVAQETERLIDAIEPAGGAELRRSLAGPLAVAVVTARARPRATPTRARCSAGTTGSWRR